MKRTPLALYDLLTSSALAVALTGAIFMFVRLIDGACEATRAYAVGHTLTHLACIALGAALLYVAQLVRSWSRESKALPPATARQLARAARANRLDMRKPPPRWIPLPKDHFTDSEDTR
jgi:hypothetical protein